MKDNKFDGGGVLGRQQSPCSPLFKDAKPFSQLQRGTFREGTFTDPVLMARYNGAFNPADHEQLDETRYPDHNPNEGF